MMIAWIIALFRHRSVDRKVGHHPAGDEVLADECANQREPVRGGELGGKGQIDFTRQLGIATLFQPFNSIPELGTVLQPGRTPARRQNLRVDDSAAAPVIGHLTATLAHKAFARAVGSGGNG